MENSYYKNLMMTVIRSSESDNWKDAVVEWDIDDCEEDLRDATSLIESQFKLLHAVEEGRYLSLSSELFSRKLLRWLYEEGAFDTEYNDYDGEDDYEFMLKMFNKRDKDSISLKQDKKIKALLLNAIKPFLQDRLAEKVR